MKIASAMPTFDITSDISTNPEFILLMAEDEEAECDAMQSLWLSGTAVTKPKSSNYDQE